MKKSWLSILGLLALVTLLSFFFMRRLQADLPPYTPPQIATPDQALPTIELPRTTLTPEMMELKNSRPDYDALSNKSLFTNARTESEGEENSVAGTKADVEQLNREFDLVGIARIGTKGKADPVAIISNTQGIKNSAGNARTAGTRSMGNSSSRLHQTSPRTPARGGGNGIQQESQKASRNIYKVGDSIENSGYKVKAILVEQDKVILSRGGKDVELKIDINNTKNSVRKENARKAEQAAREKLKSVTNASGNTAVLSSGGNGTQQKTATPSPNPQPQTNGQKNSNQSGQLPPPPSQNSQNSNKTQNSTQSQRQASRTRFQLNQANQQGTR